MVLNRLNVKHVLMILMAWGACSFCLSAQQAVNVGFTRSVTLNHDTFVHPPQWSGGAFIGIESPDSPIPIIVLFGREGHEFSRMYLRIPGARLVKITGQARGADGTVALVGNATDNEGRVAYFLAILSAQGDTEQVIRTGRYAPVRVTITPDGSIWTEGHTGVKATADAVFRRFDRSGKMIASFVPQASFRDIAKLWDYRGNAFASARDRIAFLFGKEHRYIEISLDGKVNDISVTTGPSEAALGLALTEDGKTYVSTEEQMPGIDSSPKYNFYLLDTKDGRLLPLSHKNPEFSYEVLQGVDSGFLVVMGTGGRSARYLIR